MGHTSADIRTNATENPRTGNIASRFVKGAASPLDNLSVTGFSIICAWRFLVLFSPIFSESSQGRPFAFQAALYLSLAATYALLMFSSHYLTHLFHRQGQSSWRRFNILFGCLASAATIFVLIARDMGFAVGLASWIVVAVAEALLMFPWLQMLGQRTDKMGNPINFVFNMGLGGCIAFIIGNLVSPYNLIALCVLPLLANISLAASKDKGAARKDGESAQERATRLSLGEGLVENGKFIFYGASFGICQYVLSAAMGKSDIVFYAIGSSWPICGVALSAFVISLIPVARITAEGAHSIQHFSALLFMAGLMLSFYAIVSHDQLGEAAFTLDNLSGQMLCFAGVNTFDFGFMIFAFSRASHMKGDLGPLIGLNRALLYLAMGLGLLAGWALDEALAPAIPNSTLAIVGGITVLLMASTMPLFDHSSSVEESAVHAKEASKPQAAHVEEAGVAQVASSREERIAQIASECGLSKREREIFGFLARGMTAGEIQQELWISIHTVKTHMSNVYHKLDVHSAQELLARIDEGTGAQAGGTEKKDNGNENDASKVDAAQVKRG